MRRMLTSGCLSYSAAEGDDQFKLCLTVPKLGSKNHAPTVAIHIVILGFGLAIFCLSG
jgi:hypothetical protein